jgi:hypothetical protein
MTKRFFQIRPFHFFFSIKLFVFDFTLGHKMTPLQQSSKFLLSLVLLALPPSALGGTALLGERMSMRTSTTSHPAPRWAGTVARSALDAAKAAVGRAVGVQIEPDGSVRVAEMC